MFGAAFAEVLTLAAAFPFLSLVADAGIGEIPPAVRPLLAWIGLEPIIAAALLFGAAALFATLARLLLLWLGQRFVMRFGYEISTAIFRTMLQRPYLDHVGGNSSELLAGLEKSQKIVFTLFQPVAQGAIAAVVAIFITAALFLLDPFAAGVAALWVSLAYVGVILLTRQRLRDNSRVVASGVGARIQVAREALGAIRDIILDRSHRLFEARFAAIEERHRRAAAENAFIAAAPRYLLEAVGVLTLVVVALAMTLREGGIVTAIPVLGTLALGGQRLLPLIQQAWLGWSQISAHEQSLSDILALLEEAGDVGEEQPCPPAPLAFAAAIEFDRVSYRYPDGRTPLRNVSLRIAKGERIGITGASGSGKSTLIDLLLGLLAPADGMIRIDGRRLDAETREAWQASVTHVPQSVYLVDDSIAANVAVGIEPRLIDRERLVRAVRAAELEAFVETLPDGYATPIGERGIRLSGGQRQRLGVARALYRRAALLVLDEATSALDDGTEAKLLTSVLALDPELTILIVAHRSSTLGRCDRIVVLEEGALEERVPK